MRTALAVFLFSFPPASALAADGGPTITLLGPARSISDSDSASRDTPALGMVVLPRPILTGGGQFSFIGAKGADFTLRLGFLGFLELFSNTATQNFDLGPRGDIHWWRGHLGWLLTGSWDVFEVALSLQHESSHYTGSNDGGPGTDYSQVPQIGDYVAVDAAVRLDFGDLSLVCRPRDRIFLPGRSSYRDAPGIDLDLRWRLFERVQPFNAFFAEYLFGTLGYPDASLVRDLLGVAITTSKGTMYIFGSAEIGNRAGLAVGVYERTLGFGVRVALE